MNVPRRDRRVLLVNGGPVPHYRVALYRRLRDGFLRRGYTLTVAAEYAQHIECPREDFYTPISPGYVDLATCVTRAAPDAIVFWTNPHPRIFRAQLSAKRKGIKTIHWGHRRQLQAKWPYLWHCIYNVEHVFDDAIIVYAPELKDLLPARFRRKTFVAKNTLDLKGFDPASVDRYAVRRRYGITKDKLVICLGRLQRRKRMTDLLQAFQELGLPNVGLVLAGADDEGVLGGVTDTGIYKVGPVYGQDALELLSAADVYCLPGAIGLSIVDAFHCGLPVVTERVNHGPEIMYFKEGVTGVSVSEGDIHSLAAELRRLLLDDELRKRLSRNARTEILTNGSVEAFCEGFIAAVDYALAGDVS